MFGNVSKEKILGKGLVYIEKEFGIISDDYSLYVGIVSEFKEEFTVSFFPKLVVVLPNESIVKSIQINFNKRGRFLDVMTESDDVSSDDNEVSMHLTNDKKIIIDEVDEILRKHANTSIQDEMDWHKPPSISVNEQGYLILKGPAIYPDYYYQYNKNSDTLNDVEVPRSTDPPEDYSENKIPENAIDSLLVESLITI